MTGWYPHATRNADTIGCYGSYCANEPRFFVDHIMVGWKRTLDDRAWREANEVCVTFGIGRDGSVSQYRSIFQSHWGNGVHNPQRPAIASNPYASELLGLSPRRGDNGWHYVDPRTGANWLNTHSISFEHEGMPADRWTDAMVDATVAVKRWCLEEMQREGVGFGMFDPSRLVGHFQIDAVNKSSCPGPNWPRDRIIAALSTAPEPQYDDLEVLRKGVRDALDLILGLEMSHQARLEPYRKVHAPWMRAPKTMSRNEEIALLTGALRQMHDLLRETDAEELYELGLIREELGKWQA